MGVFVDVEASAISLLVTCWVVTTSVSPITMVEIGCVVVDVRSISVVLVAILFIWDSGVFGTVVMMVISFDGRHNSEWVLFGVVSLGFDRCLFLDLEGVSISCIELLLETPLLEVRCGIAVLIMM